MNDWAEIRRLHRAEGVGIKEIARRLGLARNTVRAALRSDTPPSYSRSGKGSAVDAFEPAIRALLQQHPRMPATVIAERVGWQRGQTVLRQRVAELRRLYVAPDPCQRTEYRPGELAQWDLWFPPVDVPLGFGQCARPPVIVGVSGFSRWISARLIPSRGAHDVLSGHWGCLQDLGGVPRKGVYDGEPAISTRRGGRAVLTEDFQRFRGTLGMGAIVCKPGDPEAKGLVERANGFLETSFLPGRRFSGPDDFNGQLQGWLSRANERVHATLRVRPSERIAADRAAMLALPPVPPDPSWRFSTRLSRDHWIRVATNDYSVHPRAVGRRVDVRVDLERVTVTCGGDVVADHPRCWAKHQTLTEHTHELARKVNNRGASAPPEDPDEVEVRDLADYDRALGLT